MTTALDNITPDWLTSKRGSNDVFNLTMPSMASADASKVLSYNADFDTSSIMKDSYDTRALSIETYVKQSASALDFNINI